MTERFVDYFDKDHNYIIQDLQNEDEYQVGFVNCDEDVFLELINQLNDENEQLKKKLEFFNELNKPYGTIIEENKRLKSFINRLTNDCGEIVLMNGIGYNVKKIFGDME